MIEFPTTLSPKVIEHILDNLDPDVMDRESAIRYFGSEITTAANIFCNRFKHSYFLFSEPIHEFTALQLRSEDTGLVEDELRCRLVICPKGYELGVYMQDEIPLDEMYDVRHVIAESMLPEFWDDKALPAN